MTKIAIIGMGVMGKNHYRVIQNINNVEIVGLCDPVAKDEFSHKLYKDLDEMLNTVEIDAVIIATPTFLHKEIALKCIEKAIDLFIEKPVASTVEDGQIILKASKAKNTKVVVGHIERFNPVVQSLKNEIKDKVDGITRGQRVKYAVQGGLSDQFVLDELGLDLVELNKDIISKI